MELEEIVASCQNTVKNSVQAIQDVGASALESVDPDRQGTRPVLDQEIAENKVGGTELVHSEEVYEMQVEPTSIVEPSDEVMNDVEAIPTAPTATSDDTVPAPNIEEMAFRENTELAVCQIPGVDQFGTPGTLVKKVSTIEELLEQAPGSSVDHELTGDLE